MCRKLLLKSELEIELTLHRYGITARETIFTGSFE